MRGAAAVMALIAAPSTDRSNNSGRRQTAPLPPPVEAFNTPRNSRLKWSSPIKTDEDLNGRRMLPKAYELPRRSALAGGRAGRQPVPDTRASCAERGKSGKFFVKRIEEEGQAVGDGVGAEITHLSPEGAVAPARRSLLEQASVDGGPTSHGNDVFEEKGGQGVDGGVGSLQERVSDDNGPSSDNDALQEEQGQEVGGGVGAETSQFSPAKPAAPAPAGSLLGHASNNDSDVNQEEELGVGRVGAETTQPGPEHPVARVPGSLLEHVSNSDDVSSNPPFESNGCGADTPAAAPAASATSSTAATSLGPPRSRTESPGPQATEAAEEHGDEEQGRKLVMSYLAGSPEEDKRAVTSKSKAGAASAKEDDRELGGEEEQGRELMMTMAAGGDAPHPAISSAGEEGDETVPPSPPSAAESDDDDGSSGLSSGEDEDDAADDAVASFAEEPPPVIEWKRPKLTSAPVSGGGAGRSSTSTGTATATVVHKPALTLRSFTRFSGTSAALPSVPGPSTTGPSPFARETSPQLLINNDAHQSLPDANAMPAPPSSSGSAQRVVWKTPRQTAAPAAVTPTSALDIQQQGPSGEHDDEVSPMELELELPPEVVDASNPPAIRVLSTEVPSTSWRQPARAVSRSARHQAQRHVVPPAASTSPPSPVSSAAASSPSGERAEPRERGSKLLPRFGASPFRPPDERDSIPQGQLNALSRSAKRLAAMKAGAASKAAAAAQPRQQQRGANGRAEANGAPVDGRARGRDLGSPVAERHRSTSSSSGPTWRDSPSRSSSRSTTASRQGRPDFSAREDFRRNSRDGYGRGSEGRGRREFSHSSSSSRNSSRTGPGGRMAGYRDSGGDRADAFGRDERCTGGYGNRDERGRRASNGRRGGGDDFDRNRRKRSEKDGSRGGFPDRRSEHNGNRPRSHHWRDRSRSPIR